MSRRNTRQGKARRRGERDRRQVTERERKRPGIPGQDPQAVEDQAVQAAPRPDGSGPRNSDEHGSGLRSDVGGSLIAVDPGEADLGTDADLENADPVDFGDLDPDDADLQAVLAEEDLAEGDLGEVPAIWPATSTYRKYRTDLGTPWTPSLASRPRTPRPWPPAGRAPAWSSCPRTAAARTRRSSSSVTTTTISRPRRSRWPAPPRTRSRTTSSRSARCPCSTPSRRSSWPSGSRPACSPRRSWPSTAAACRTASGTTWSGSPRTGDAPRTT